MNRLAEHVRTSADRSRSIAAALLVVAAGIAATDAKAALYTVGGDGCDFPAIQAALDAAAATIADDEIRIARNVEGGDYRDVALVANRSSVAQGSPGALRLVGGFDDCDDATPSGRTDLFGGVDASSSVLRIAGGDVEIEGLRFSGAGPDAFGGGIKYGGAGRLVLRDVSIDDNKAVWGGGLAVFGHGGGTNAANVLIEHSEIGGNRAEFGGAIALVPVDAGVELRTGDDVRIFDNDTSKGGGAIAMQRGAALVMGGNGLHVDNNTTVGDGGAILGVAPVTIRLGAAPRADQPGTFTRNTASNGGVLALTDGWGGFGISQGRASVSIVSDDPAHPLVMALNQARERGGAVWVFRPPWGLTIDDVSEVCAWNVGIEENYAVIEGSALAVSGSLASYRQTAACANDAPACGDEACNGTLRNVAAIVDGEVVGSIYGVAGGASVRLDDARIVGNAAESIFGASSTIAGFASSVDVRQALVARNSGDAILGPCNEGCDFAMRSATVVDNVLYASVFENGTSAFALADSIVGQPGVPLFAVDPPAGTVANVLYDALYDGGAPTLWPGSASFMDASAGDYRLTADSAGIDALPAAGGADLRGRPRDVDIPDRDGMGGIRDLGAFETQLDEIGDTLFVDGFERRP